MPCAITSSAPAGKAPCMADRSERAPLPFAAGVGHRFRSFRRECSCSLPRADLEAAQVGLDRFARADGSPPRPTRARAAARREATIAPSSTALIGTPAARAAAPASNRIGRLANCLGHLQDARPTRTARRPWRCARRWRTRGWWRRSASCASGVTKPFWMARPGLDQLGCDHQVEVAGHRRQARTSAAHPAARPAARGSISR